MNIVSGCIVDDPIYYRQRKIESTKIIMKTGNHYYYNIPAVIIDTNNIETKEIHSKTHSYTIDRHTATPTLICNFMKHVNGDIDDDDKCLLWTGQIIKSNTTNTQRPVFTMKIGGGGGEDKRKKINAKLISLAWFTAQSVTNKDTIHSTCKNSLCVNPSHLRVMINNDNGGDNTNVNKTKRKNTIFRMTENVDNIDYNKLYKSNKKRKINET